MAITRLHLESVRNLSQVQLEPSSGFNFIIGPNGAGKSSLLEAIHMLGSGRSFRTSRHRQLIQHEQSKLTIFAQVERGQHQHKVGMQRDKQGELLLRINGETTQRLSDLVGLFPLQLLTPESANLLTSGTKARRQFLDWGLFYQSQQFFETWRRYSRILKQRNAMIRQQADYSQVAYWDQQLIEYGQQISEMRCSFIERLQLALQPFTAKFLPDFEVTLEYLAGWDLHSDLAELLKAGYPRDLKLGHTQLGPHRASFRIKLNQVLAEQVGSRGQLKLLVAALTLAQGALLSEQQGIPCTYLVDDFAAELDESKRALLIKSLIDIQSQVFITATDHYFMEQVSSHFDAHHTQPKVFQVEQGALVFS